MRKLISKIILFSMAFLVLPSFTFAAPVISNAPAAIQHGQNNVTVSGTGFGTKISGNAAPIRFDDFESGTTGHDATTDFPWWSKSTNTPAILIDNSKPRGVSTKSIEQYLKAGLDSNETNAAVSILYKNNIGFATTGKILVSYWTYWDWGTTYVQNGGENRNYYQIKECDLVGEIGATGGVTKFPDVEYIHYMYNLDTTPYAINYWQDYYNGSGSVNITLRDAGSNSHDLEILDGWYHTIEQIDMGSPGTADGSWTMYQSAYNSNANYYKSTASDVMILGDANNTNYIDAMKLGWYRHYVNQGESYIYHDDIYIDNSWARVEIGDASTYDTCTHREIQIPSAWSDTGITFTANRGSFADGQAYLYITDENGVQNASGYPITLSSGGDTTAPGAPSGLSVQ